jgi:quercetin dioxygenase-like cupin family protein
LTSYIFAAAEVEANSDFINDRKVHTTIPVTGESCQLLWVKYEPGRTYELHSHPHQKMSVIVSGRMRLMVGDEVRDIGPGPIRSDEVHSIDLVIHLFFLAVRINVPPIGGDHLRKIFSSMVVRISSN